MRAARAARRAALVPGPGAARCAQVPPNRRRTYGNAFRRTPRPSSRADLRGGPPLPRLDRTEGRSRRVPSSQGCVQLAPSVEESRSDGRCRDLERLRRLFGGESLELDEDEHRTLSRAELCERALEDRQLLVVACAALRIARRACRRA